MVSRLQRDHIPRQAGWPIIIAGLCFTCISVTLMATRPQALRELEALSYDALLRQLPAETSTSRVAIVEIDEQSLAQYGQWPWPRYHLAALLDALRREQAASVGIDILFSEPDRSTPAEVMARYQRDLGIALPSFPPFERLPDGDARLAASIAQLPVVLGIWTEPTALPSSGPLEPVQPLALRKSEGAPVRAPLQEQASALGPLPGLAGSAQALGFLNARPDDDGKTRRAPLFVRAGGTDYPALAVAAVLLALGETQAVARLDQAGLAAIQVGDRQMPVDPRGNLLLPFRPNVIDRIQKVSASSLLKGESAPELRGKVVLVGVTASGLHDMHATPLSRATPGIYLHALLADTLLAGNALEAPRWEHAAQAGLVLALGLSLTLLMAYAPLTFATLVALVLALALGILSHLLLTGSQIAFVPLGPALSLLAGTLLLGTLRHRMAEKYTLARVRELAASQECALRGFASVAETRDPETGAHITRTQDFVRVLAEHLQHHPSFRHELTPENIQLIVKSAPLHDIGKVSVPDRVLLKPGKLTEDEFEVMKQHARAGYDILRRARAGCKFSDQLSFLHYSEEMALTHHEKWDGSGYPSGLSGRDIPLAGRLMALADVYDALRTKRVYKPAIPHEKAREIILEGTGKHFDPDIVAAFLESEQEFQAISDRHPDNVVEAPVPAPKSELKIAVPV